MDQRVQLRHPGGKKPVTMEKGKYDLLKRSFLKQMRVKRTATFGEIAKAVSADLKSTGKKFQGSLPWHLEWVKLDLEARKMIRRIPETSPQEYKLVR